MRKVVSTASVQNLLAVSAQIALWEHEPFLMLWRKHADISRMISGILYCFLLMSLSISTNFYCILEVSMVILKWIFYEIPTSGWTARADSAAGELPYRSYRTRTVGTIKKKISGSCKQVFRRTNYKIIFVEKAIMLLEHERTSMSGAYIFCKWQTKLKLI